MTRCGYVTHTLRDAAEPWDIVPVEARVDERLERRRQLLISNMHPGNAYADGTSDTLVLLDLVALLYLGVGRVVNLLHAHILFTATELRSIDGNEEALDATLLSMLHILPGDLAVAVDVELEEELLVIFSCVDDVVERAGCERGDLRMMALHQLQSTSTGRSGTDHLDYVVLGRGAGDRQFTFRVSEFSESGSRLAVSQVSNESLCCTFVEHLRCRAADLT